MVSSQQGVSRPYFIIRDDKGQEHRREPFSGEVILHEGAPDAYLYGPLHGVDLSGLAGSTVTEIVAHQEPLREIDLSPLEKVKGLRKIHLNRCDFHAIDFQPLRTCRDLEEVSISDNKIPAIDLSIFEGMKGLKYLNIAANCISELDLTPLRTCSNLEYLAFYGNPLREIDLSPLSDCVKLRSLRIGGDNLSTLDLTPLSTLEFLMEFEIAGVPLDTVDLTPVASCKNIRTVRLWFNKFTTIDLSPLGELVWLGRLNLSKTSLRTLDLTPLSRCFSLKSIDVSDTDLDFLDVTPLSLLSGLLSVRNGRYEPMTNTPSVAIPLQSLFLPSEPNYFYREVNEAISRKGIDQMIDNGEWSSFKKDFLSLLRRLPPVSRFIFQGEFLGQIGLGHYRALDADISDLLEEFHDIDSVMSLRTVLESQLVPLLVDQIQQEGPSHFLDIDSLWQREITHPLVHPILASRRQETSDVLVPIHNEIVDLRPLWLTSHGFQLLSSLLDTELIDLGMSEYDYRNLTEIPFPLSIPADQFPSVIESCDASGIILNTQYSPLTDLSQFSSMSHGMIEYILWSARFDRQRTDEHK